MLDFGLAKVTSEGQADSGLTREGQMLGTPDYIAPEQIRDAQSADIRADIYSLGCTFYYLLTGGPPFRGEHLWDVYQAHFSMDAGPLNLVRPEVPVELAALVAKMMAKEPGRRFQTPGEVAQALMPFFKKVGVADKGVNPEISQVSEPIKKKSTPRAIPVPTPTATEAAPAPVSEARKPAPTQPGSILEGLIDLGETEPLFDRNLDIPGPVAALAASRRYLRLWSIALEKRRRPRLRAWWTAGSVLLLACLVTCGVVVLSLKTANGTIVLENVPADAVVEVDGDRIPITPTVGEPVIVVAQAGKHVVLVKRGADVLIRETVTLESGKQLKLTAPYESSVQSRPAPKDANATRKPVDDLAPPRIDRTRFTIVSGQWALQGDDLVHTDENSWYNELLFGDDQWADYDFMVDAMRVGGHNSFSLFFRSTDQHNLYDYVISGEDNKTCWFQARDEGRGRILNRFDFAIQNNEWYTAHVHVRGHYFACSLFHRGSGSEIRVFFSEFNDDRHPKGRVGLGTFLSAYRFKNIKVTAPDGSVLWEGLPAVDSPKLTKSQTLADPPQPSVVPQERFEQLFNGMDRTRWKIHPSQPGNWNVENGNLVCSGPATSHLYTVRDDLKNFHLRVDARISDVGKSGVFVRSSPGPTWPANKPTWPLGYEARISSKPEGRNYTGSLFAGTDRAVVSVNVPPVLPFEWFTLEVIAQGNHVVVKVNGMTTADYHDEKQLFARGTIALQHNPQTIVEFRKIEIKELDGPDSTQNQADRAGVIPLFNGTDLSGWHLDRGDPSTWGVEDGSLIAHGPNDWTKQSFLLSDGTFSDFLLRFQFQLLLRSDSGVVLRAVPGGNHIEVNLRNFADAPRATEATHAQTGAIHWSTSGAGADYLPPKRPAELRPNGAWNDMEIELWGQSLRVSVNGRLIQSADFRSLAAAPNSLPDLKRKSGRVGFQSHTGGVRFRNIEIKELAPSPLAANTKTHQATPKDVKAGTRRVGIRPPADAKEFRGKSYKVFRQQMSWHEARDECRKLGGHLAVVTTAEREPVPFGIN